MKSGWVTKRLGEIGEIVRGKGIRRSETVAKGKPCLRYGEIYTSFNYVLDNPCSFVPESIYRECPHIKRGDVVFSLTGENKEEIAKSLAYLGDEEVAAGGDLAIWTNHGCDAKYLAYMMYAPAMIEAKAHASNGDIIVHASVKKMQQIEIPIPPLPEQRRIVAKIDAAFAKIDRLKANAEKNLTNAKELFQSALNEAIRPKPGWVEKLLGEHYLITSSKRVFKEQWKSSGVPFYRAREIVRLARDGFVENELFISEEMFAEYGKKYGLPNADDIMITGVGTLGVCYVVKEGDRFYFKDGNIIWLKKTSEELDSRYVELCFSTDDVIKQVHANQGATVGTYTIEMAKATVVYAPSIEIQRLIVEDIQRLKEKFSVLQSNYTRLIADCAEMRQAVLKEAFEGRL